MMRYIMFVLCSFFFFFHSSTIIHANTDDMVSMIIEVDGDPKKHKNYIEKHFPLVEVVETYDILINGIAIQGHPRHLEKMESLDFIKNVHEVQQYKAIPVTIDEQGPVEDIRNLKKNENLVFPEDLNDTEYTGKGIKVGVIDTGIDYNHPDLSENYKAGYDLVDLDDDPMETLVGEGIPTNHGSHVAGIIAANGELKGVAPEAEIYAYRALGPGGAGTSVQVIAAMEQAVKDKVDVMNLSLGNSVNGPDYPTSLAVNRAVELGIPVVIANGNSGPDRWTVGSPATAPKAFSVGASTNPQNIPYLLEPISQKPILIQPMLGSVKWDIEKELEIVSGDEEDLYGKIALVERGEIPFYELAKEAEEKGAEAVLIANNEEKMIQGSIDMGEKPVQIPVAMIQKEDGDWLFENLSGDNLYLKTAYHFVDTTIAPFSSRGPVTVNWDIKPDILAPGTNILSTVPGGYQALQGTSMATPHVAGVIALIKEAHPDWSTEQIYSAIETTAKPLVNAEGVNTEPIIQGMGIIQPNAAIETETIIHDAKLSFGKMEQNLETKVLDIKIENISNQEQTFTFNVPNKEKGIAWKLPQSFTVNAGETKKVPIQLTVTSGQLEEGLHQGWLTLNKKDSEDSYQLPYIFINQQTDNPKAFGFDFALKTFSSDAYMYQIYLSEPAQKVTVDLYDPQTLMFNRNLLTLEDVKVGMNEGEMLKKEIGERGIYTAVVTVTMEDGSYESYEQYLILE